MDADEGRFGFKKTRRPKWRASLLPLKEQKESIHLIFKERLDLEQPRITAETKRPICAQRYFFIKSSTALVIATTPVRIVGSGTGANLLECKLGSGGAPGFFEAAIFSGATAPT